MSPHDLAVQVLTEGWQAAKVAAYLFMFTCGYVTAAVTK